jgi:hypothetical protein
LPQAPRWAVGWRWQEWPLCHRRRPGSERMTTPAPDALERCPRAREPWRQHVLLDRPWLRSPISPVSSAPAERAGRDRIAGRADRRPAGFAGRGCRRRPSAPVVAGRLRTPRTRSACTPPASTHSMRPRRSDTASCPTRSRAAVLRHCPRARRGRGRGAAADARRPGRPPGAATLTPGDGRVQRCPDLDARSRTGGSGWTAGTEGRRSGHCPCRLA